MTIKNGDHYFQSVEEAKAQLDAKEATKIAHGDDSDDIPNTYDLWKIDGKEVYIAKDPTIMTQDEIKNYHGNVFACPVCDETHDLKYDKRILCECGAEFYTVLAGKDGIDKGILQSLQLELKKGAAVVKTECSVVEGWFGLVLVLGKPDVKEAVKCGNSSHIGTSRDDLRDVFFILNLTG